MLAISRRFMSRCLKVWGEGRFLAGLLEGLRNTVAPDRRHIHHRLLDLGFTQRRAVGLLYLAAISTGGLAYLVAASVDWVAAPKAAANAARLDSTPTPLL